VDPLAVAVAVVPVFAFLAGLVFLDGYKLVSGRRIALSVLFGAGAALLCWGLASLVFRLGGPFADLYAKALLPLVEESAKALPVIVLIRRRRLGFTVDAAIVGFAVGAGFSLVENAWYLAAMPDRNLAVWLLRGFGTALLHGTNTLVVAVATRCLADLRPGLGSAVCLPGLVTAWAVHAVYNLGWLPPAAASALLIFGLPVLAGAVFLRSEAMLHRWLGEGMDHDVARLREITSGHFSSTPSGHFLRQVARTFPPETVVDIHCYLRVWLELSIRAKGDLLRKEAGLPVEPDPAVADKLRELKALERSIGRAGLRALAPILTRTSRDFWQIHQLESGAGG
jgi:RsiW-degrading membrane proteinase PrsW (M82 family)